MTDRRLGPYRLIRPLGRGGMAEVYLAETAVSGGFHKLLALKRLLPRFGADKELVTMLADEARLSVWLHHPNIVQVLDFGQDDGTYYLALEYVDGCDMRALIRNAGRRMGASGGALPVPTALYLLARVLDGLDHAHRRRDARGRPLRIIHRDVSPHNILVSREGQVKLADFGLARAAVSAHRTDAGIVRGKFAYMPREQAQGAAIDHRVDIFAAGVTLYQALTGVRPYSSANLAQQLYQLERPVRPPSSHVAEIPIEIDELTMQAMSPDVASRYQTAAQLADDVGHALAQYGSPVEQERCLAELVVGAVPHRAGDQAAHLPAASIFDVEVPRGSLIADAVIAAQQTLLGGDMQRAPRRHAGQADASPIDTEDSDELRKTLVRERAAPRTEELAQLDELSEVAPRGASVGRSSLAARLSVAPPAKPSRGYHDARESSTVGGLIETHESQRAPAVSTRRAPSRKRRPRESSVSSGARLVDAINQADSRKRRRRDPLLAVERALDSYRRDAVVDDTLTIRHGSSSAAKLFALVLAVAAAVGLSVAGGWLLRGRIERAQLSESSASPEQPMPGAARLPPPVAPAPNGGRHAAPAGGTSAVVDAGMEATAGSARRASSGDVVDAGRDVAGESLVQQRERPRVVRRAQRQTARTAAPRRRPAPSRTAPKRRTLGKRAQTDSTSTPPRQAAHKRVGGKTLLMISSSRSAYVFVDDRMLGRTPLKTKMKAGIYRVKLIYEDQSSSPVRWVSVEEGKRTEVAFE